jgi:hypothetical protein
MGGARVGQSARNSCNISTRGVQLFTEYPRLLSATLTMDRNTQALQLELKRLREGLWLSDYVRFKIFRVNIHG